MKVLLFSLNFSLFSLSVYKQYTCVEYNLYHYFIPISTLKSKHIFYKNNLKKKNPKYFLTEIPVEEFS